MKYRKDKRREQPVSEISDVIYTTDWTLQRKQLIILDKHVTQQTTTYQSSVNEQQKSGQELAGESWRLTAFFSLLAGQKETDGD